MGEKNWRKLFYSKTNQKKDLIKRITVIINRNDDDHDDSDRKWVIK